MQNTNTYIGNEQRGEIPNEGGAAQQLEQVLASGLPPLCRRAYRILGNAADAEDAVQDALLAAYRYVKRSPLVALNTFNRFVTHMTTISVGLSRTQSLNSERHLA